MCAMDPETVEIAVPSSENHTDPLRPSPLLALPRELRDLIWHYVFAIPDHRDHRAIRIERRHLTYFKPIPVNVLLILHHEYLLLNRQIAAEALKVLFQEHNVFLSCGPFVLKAFLSRIENDESGAGKLWLKWLKHIELDWVTFPNLRFYPPEWEESKDISYWEQDREEIDVDYVDGLARKGGKDYYNEESSWDYEGPRYDDNFYQPGGTSLYPSFEHHNTTMAEDSDPFGFSTHYPFQDPLVEPSYDTIAQEDIYTKLDLLIDMEVTPLFTYLASPTFSLSSITLPLYFISKQTYQHRSISRPGYLLPLKLRYWVQVVVHALLMLHPVAPHTPKLDEVRIKYMPWDIWASMDPSDDLFKMCEKGIWGGEEDEEGEGEAFKAVWDGLAQRGAELSEEDLDVKVRLVKWEGDLDRGMVGDELEVVIRRAKGKKSKGVQV
ncbi:hypothetical protein K469DRAFT_705558 [Zopfia rhizophila CBS 207.26]|uniref:F-box domain-containing protein n=1 Tax=Zopfia rhizophila CBS 207.26 TaxID=1314779 RepID=A0A6A6EA47_9PEZI|nr:hypothetical protein K469DRAFT_705558 [Zopfia rhizophila CBS 207.26]